MSGRVAFRIGSFLLAGVAFTFCAALGQSQDPLLEAMKAEAQRALQLQLENLEKPYFVEFATHDATLYYVSATLGAVADRRIQRARLPRVRIRVGSYEFDNGNYILSGASLARSFEVPGLPLEGPPVVLRHFFWLVSDAAYKSALQAIALKRAALRNLSPGEDKLPDFARAEPLRLLEPPPSPDSFSEGELQQWEARVRALSAAFRPFVHLTASGVDFQASVGAYYLVNTEGTEVRVPEQLFRVQIRSSALAPDGMVLRDYEVFLGRKREHLPGVEQLREAVNRVGRNVSALRDAPRGEDYTGPVLFEPLAAAQLLADLFGRNIGYRRRPVSDPGRPVSFAESQLQGRVGSRILPEWIDIIDDPTLEQWKGHPLAGHFLVDLEGVRPRPVRLVEKGVLKTMLATRQPVKERSSSDGRARLLGNFLAYAPVFGNLIVEASEQRSWEELKKRVVELAVQRGKSYGLLVRKLDFPSTATPAELQRLAARASQTGGAGQLVSPPLLVYRVYPDGKQELVRGLRWRELSVRSLRDIVLAGGEPAVFHYLETGAAMALSSGASVVAECSVIAPGLLFEELQLEPAREEMPRLPIVPSPLLELAQ